MRSREKSLLVAELAQAKKAEDIVILDMRKLSNVTDFFVIASTSSMKRAQTVAEHIREGLIKRGESIFNIEGYEEGLWILIDAYEVVGHIFYNDVRRFYNLEGLWSDAPKVKLCRRKKRKKPKRPRLKKSSKKR